MIRVNGWDDGKIRSREDVFEGLVRKSIRLCVRALTASLGEIITAANLPEPTAVPKQAQPVFTSESVAAVTATWEQALVTELQPFLTQSFIESALAVREAAVTTLGADLPAVGSDLAAEYLKSAVNRMAGIGDELWTVIRDQLNAGYALGESTQQLAARLRATAGLTEPRALATARTEVMSAINAGSYQQMIVAGFTDDELSKEWLATEDERTRPTHRAADGQQVPISQSFTVGGEAVPFPGAPTISAGNRINCRCTVGYVFADDFEDSDVDVDAPLLVTASVIIRPGDITLDPDILVAADEWTPADEKKHPRDASGKFAKKPGSGIKIPKYDADKPFNTAVWINDLDDDDWENLTQEQRLKVTAYAQRLKVDQGNDAPLKHISTLKSDSAKSKSVVVPAYNESNPKGMVDWIKSLTQDDWNSLTFSQKLKITEHAENIASDFGDNTPNEHIGELQRNVKKSTPATPSANVPAAQLPLLPYDKKNAPALAKWIKSLKQSDWESMSSVQQKKVALDAISITEDIGDNSAEEHTYDLQLKQTINKQNADYAKSKIEVKVLKELKPISVNTKVIYGTKYADGQVVAVKVSPFGGPKFRLTWNETMKKFILQQQMNDGTWMNAENYGKGAAYQKFSKQTDWYEPDDEVDSDFTPPAKPATTPATTPAQPTQHQTTADLTTPSADGWPSASQLSYTGKQVGTHGAKIYKDKVTGKEYLFKPNTGMKFGIELDVAMAKLHALAGLPTPEVRKATLDGNTGSLQELIPGKQAFPTKFKPTDHDGDTFVALQQEQIFDWLTGNHDSHPGNFVKTDQQELLGVDKGQAFKFFGSDQLSETYHPNVVEAPPIYNALWQAYIVGEIDLAPIDSQYLKSIIDKLTSIPDAEYRALLRPYAEAAAKAGTLAKGSKYENDVEKFLDAATYRKSNLQVDPLMFYAKMKAKRDAYLAAKKKSTAKTTPPVSTSTPVPSNVSPNLPPAPTVTGPGVGTPAKQKPLKVNTKTIYGTTYVHNAVVAERKLGSFNQRIVWNANLKKFAFQIQDPDDGTWATGAVYTKKDAYEKFSKDTDWLTPTGSGGVAGGDGVAVPTTTTTPGYTAPAVPASSKKVAVTVPGGIVAIDQLIGENGDISSINVNYVGENVKKGSNTTDKTIFLSSPPADVFENVVKFAKNAGITPLQALRALDQWSVSKSGDANNNLYEKKLIKWLGTAAGKKQAQEILSGKTASTVSAAQVDIPTAADIGTPSTDPNITFDNLSSASAIAMQKKMKTWTPKEAEDLTTYTGGSYSAINGVLRGTKQPTDSLVSTIEGVQSAMAPVPRSFVVYRGTGFAQFGLPENFGTADSNVEKLKKMVGAVVTDKGFVSTSVDASKKFSGAVSIEIKVPEGTPGAYVKTVSQHSSENEFLLAAGTNFVIESVTSLSNSGNPKVKVVLRVVP